MGGDEHDRPARGGENLVDRLEPRCAVFELDHDQFRLALGCKGDRLPVGARHPDHLVSEVLEDGLEVHRDDRLVLDDENPGGEAAGDVARPALQQRAHPNRVEAHDRRRLCDREAFYGREQESRADLGGKRSEIAVERRLLLASFGRDPITRHIWHATGFATGEAAGARLDKLEGMIARSGLDAKDIAPFLAALLSIPFEGRYPPIEMTPAEQKERTIAALLALFEGLTKDAPVLALLEDAHWIDPTSLDVFSRLVDRLPGLRALLIVTFRLEFAPPWVGRANVSSLALSRFGRRQALAMVDRVVGGKALPTEVLEQIVSKTDGVPLFVEELTKTVLELGLLREENGAYVLCSALTPLAIPSTLQDSLMARLDRLAPVKEIAQIGAAIGREFSYRLLEAVSPIHGLALQDALGQLMAAELIHARGAPPKATYVFKHALVQDTAYASLLRSRRQRIHADIARALEERFADQIETAPAIIAHHYTEAGLSEPAARYWLKAAELALSRSAPLEADRYIDAGLGLIPRLPDGPDRQSLELALLIARANAQVPLKGYPAAKTVEAYIEAKRLLDAGVGTDLQRFSVLIGLCLNDVVAAHFNSALALAHQIVDIADRQADTSLRLAGYRVLATTQFFMGENRKALESAQLAEQYRDAGWQKLLSYRFVTDPGLTVLCYEIWALCLLGLHNQAAGVTERVQSELVGHGHAPTVAQCRLFTVVWPELFFGNLEDCERHSAELVAYCIQEKVESFRLWGALFHACAGATRAATPENIKVIRATIDEYHRSGARLFESAYISYLAEALLKAGDVTGAKAALQQAFAFVESSGECFWLAELHRLDGRIALKQPDPDPARTEACFLKAVDVARSQEAHMLELRAATDLARLWRDTGSPNDPCVLLEPILAAIEGGETTKDVRDARALFAEIGSVE